jgi:hypothetical protein
MAAPNIVGVTTVLGKTAVLSVTTSETAVLLNSNASGKVLKVNALIVANIDGTNPADISVRFKRSATNYSLANTIPVPADSSLVVISKESPIYLEEGDGLYALASAASDLQIVCSYEDIS